MYEAQRELLAGSCVFLLMAAYGLWLTIKALKQIREPTHVRELGIGWGIDLMETFSGGAQKNEIDQALSTPIIVRLASGCILMVGIAMLFMPIMAYILVRWILK